MKDAVCDVCAQFDREQVRVVPHIWDSNSSAGLQADDVWYPWGKVAV